MVTVTVSPGTLDTAGVDIASTASIDVEAPESIVTYGPPISFGTAEQAAAMLPTTSPDGVRARVLDEDGVFIAHLPHAQGLRWLDEHNSPGSGSIDTTRYDDLEAEHPGLWEAGNQIVISVGSRDVFRLILDAQGGYQLDDVGQRADSWAGTGALGVLNSGMVIPEYGWRYEATEERSFDYGSNPSIGGWLVAGEWKTPVGKLVRKSWRWTYKRRHLPKGWPDRKAQWLWWKNPDAKGVANEICYFRSSFVLAEDSRVKIWACGDDTLELQLDGEVRLSAGPGDWKRPQKFVMYLSAGTHYVAAKVQNTPATTGAQNRSGFLCSIARVQPDGDIIAWVRRTRPDRWTVRRQLSGPPGWFPAQILRQLVAEQQSRGCAGHAPITFGFTTAKDSAGAAWIGRRDMAIPVGTRGLDWLQQLVEAGIDVAMTPGLKLNAWRKRGTDRSRIVRIDQGGHPTAESSPQLPGIVNVLYAKAKTGWVGTSDSASIAASGRRENVVSLGSSRSRTASLASLNSMLPDMADPPPTIEVHLSGATGVQPYRDFDVADWVGYRPAGATTWGRYRVMSIAGEVNDAGHPDWTLQLYED